MSEENNNNPSSENVENNSINEETSTVTEEKIVVGVSSTESVLDTVYNQIKHLLGGKQIDASNWMLLVTIGMQAVETVPSLSGTDKKDLLIKAINLIISDLNLDDALVPIIQNTVSGLIDTVASAAKGEFDINKVVVKVKKGCFSCFSRFSKK